MSTTLPRKIGVEIECLIDGAGGCPCAEGCSGDHQCQCSYGCNCPCRCENGCNCSVEDRCSCWDGCECPCPCDGGCQHDDDDLVLLPGPLADGETEDDRERVCPCGVSCQHTDAQRCNCSSECGCECRCSNGCGCDRLDRCNCRDSCECPCPCEDGCSCDRDEVPTVSGLPARWIAKRDGSLPANGVEVVSPPILDLDEVTTVCRTIRRHGAEVTKECGLHIHVEAGDLNADGLAALVHLWKRVHKTVWGLVDPTRLRSYYCRPYRTDEWSSLETTISNRENPIGAVHDRYRDMNLMSYRIHGTVEFRLHQGTVNSMTIKAFASVLVEIVEAAKRVQDLWTSKGPNAGQVQVQQFLGTGIEDLHKYLARVPLTGGEGIRQRRLAAGSRLGVWLDYLKQREQKFSEKWADTPLIARDS